MKSILAILPYNIDSLINKLNMLNGTTYEFSGELLGAYGGYGYGSFEWHDINRFGDTVSIVTGHCTGHCGSNGQVGYSKNVFDKQGQIRYIVSYPLPGEGVQLDDESTLREYDEFFASLINEEHQPDTFFYAYDNKGLLLNNDYGRKIENSEQVKKLFKGSEAFSENKFHQCYIGNITMEEYLNTRLGFTPELILIEVYKYGVFSYVLNPKDKKYYDADAIMLER